MPAIHITGVSEVKCKWYSHEKEVCARVVCAKQAQIIGTCMMSQPLARPACTHPGYSKAPPPTENLVGGGRARLGTRLP